MSTHYTSNKVITGVVTISILPPSSSPQPDARKIHIETVDTIQPTIQTTLCYRSKPYTLLYIQITDFMPHIPITVNRGKLVTVDYTMFCTSYSSYITIDTELYVSVILVFVIIGS